MRSRMFAELPATRVGSDTSCDKLKFKHASTNSLESLWFPCVVVPVCQLILGRLKSPNSKIWAFGWAEVSAVSMSLSFFAKSGFAFGGL